MSNFLDTTGLTYLWNKLKGLLVDQNDYMTEDDIDDLFYTKINCEKRANFTYLPSPNSYLGKTLLYDLCLGKFPNYEGSSYFISILVYPFYDGYDSETGQSIYDWRILGYLYTKDALNSQLIVSRYVPLNITIPDTDDIPSGEIDNYYNTIISDIFVPALINAGLPQGDQEYISGKYVVFPEYVELFSDYGPGSNLPISQTLDVALSPVASSSIYFYDSNYADDSSDVYKHIEMTTSNYYPSSPVELPILTIREDKTYDLFAAWCLEFTLPDLANMEVHHKTLYIIDEQLNLNNGKLMCITSSRPGPIFLNKLLEYQSDNDIVNGGLFIVVPRGNNADYICYYIDKFKEVYSNLLYELGITSDPSSEHALHCFEEFLSSDPEDVLEALIPSTQLVSDDIYAGYATSADLLNLVNHNLQGSPVYLNIIQNEDRIFDGYEKAFLAITDEGYNHHSSILSEVPE